jgi:hypothetical protein
MEDLLELYAEPYDALYPVVCFAESPYQLVSETRQPLPLAPGRPARYDYEYRREGTCNCSCSSDRWPAGAMSRSRRGAPPKTSHTV